MSRMKSLRPIRHQLSRRVGNAARTRRPFAIGTMTSMAVKFTERDIVRNIAYQLSGAEPAPQLTNGKDEASRLVRQRWKLRAAGEASICLDMLSDFACFGHVQRSRSKQPLYAATRICSAEMRRFAVIQITGFYLNREGACEGRTPVCRASRLPWQRIRSRSCPDCTGSGVQNKNGNVSRSIG